MTFGNYVLFNLLVAILVEGFSQEVCFFWTCFYRSSFTILTVCRQFVCSTKVEQKKNRKKTGSACWANFFSTVPTMRTASEEHTRQCRRIASYSGKLRWHTEENGSSKRQCNADNGLQRYDLTIVLTESRPKNRDQFCEGIYSTLSCSQSSCRKKPVQPAVQPAVQLLSWRARANWRWRWSIIYWKA